MKRIIKLYFTILIVVGISSCSTPTFNENDINLIPKPNKLVLKEESFHIQKKTTISISNKQQNKAVIQLNKMLWEAAGFQLETNELSSGDIVFIENNNLTTEAYKLNITPSKIIIEASDEAGYFYAVQTIRQLLPKEIERNDVNTRQWFIPCVSIEDQPRFKWRGMHMDFSRHFFSVDEVKEFLDYMALYKLNTYHMHLTDDQGWRIEIKKYPLLTEKGAWRVESKHDKDCIERAKTNPLFEIDKEHYHNIRGQKMYGGFFTQAEIKEIVKYADERCITVMPEIDIPGHFKAAIDNYPYLTCNGEAGWGEKFSLPACLGQEQTYDFIKDILSEVADLFPGEYIHIGGDEVNIASWKTCQKCQAEMKKHTLKDEHELQSHFNRNIEKFLVSKGKRLMGWDEIVEGGLSKKASMMWWRNWVPKMRDKAANNGNDMVITPDFEYYFDFMNEATPLNKVYNYEPIPEHFTEEQAKYIIGVQANLWSEKIPNFKRLQYQAFPRVLALSETGWSKIIHKDFKDFTKRLSSHYQRMNEIGIYYYIPPVEGISETIAYVDSVSIELRTTSPEFEIYYTLDGKEPTKASNIYTAPITIDSDIEIRASVYNGEVHSEITIGRTEKQSYIAPLDESKKDKLVPGVYRWVAENKFGVVEEVQTPANPNWELLDEISLGQYKAKERYSMVFKGYVIVDSNGIYEFGTQSDDGSLLYIGEKLVVDNGGNHSSKISTGSVALKKGCHPVILKYHQGTGNGLLHSWIKAPGKEKVDLLLNVEKS